MFDEDLANLDEGIRRLRVEYLIFFNGHRRKPPEDLRFRVEKMVKRLAETSSLSYAQRFRYNTLVGRFYVMRDQWRRKQQAMEAGLNKLESPVERNNAANQSAAQRPTDGMSINITDPKIEQDKIRYLYERLQSLRNDCAKTPPDISFQQFTNYIASQTEKIQGKFQCESVVFRLSLEEDRITFTARAS